jgi:hypothetical protein
MRRRSGADASCVTESSVTSGKFDLDLIRFDVSGLERLPGRARERGARSRAR